MTDTTNIVSLEEMKTHLRIGSDEVFFDTDVAAKMEAARTFIEGWTGPLDDFEEDVPASLKEALKLVTGHLFLNREAAEVDPPGEIPFGFHDLLGEYRKWEF